MSKPEFVEFNLSTPLVQFLGATGFVSTENGTHVLFRVAQGVERDGQDIGGQTAIINTADLNAIKTNFLPCIVDGEPGRPHRYHGITPEQALKLDNDFDIALGMTGIARDNARVQAADLHRLALGA